MLTRTDILFCWTFAVGGVTTFSYGLDTCLHSSYHGAGLMLTIVGLIMVALSTIDSGKV